MVETAGLSSRIDQVTVFARGARVRRVAPPRPVNELPGRVRFGALPISVIDGTVRAEVEGPAVVTSVRVSLSVPPDAGGGEESAQLRAARTGRDLAVTEVERLELALDRLASAPVIAEDESDEPPAAWDATLAARRALIAARAERQLALRNQLAAARQVAADAERAFEVAAERDGRTSTARAARAHESRKVVDLELERRGESGDVTIRIEYQVAAARWSPSYVARLDGDGARFELRAIVAQSSGEDWERVSLRLSTAEPDRFTALPELHPQKIGRRQPDVPRRGFRPPPVGAETLYADYDRAFPSRPVPQRVPEPMPPPPAPAPMSAYAMPAPGAMPMLAEQAAPMPVARAKRAGIANAVAAPLAFAAQSLAKKDAGGGGGESEGSTEKPVAVTGINPRLDYGDLRMSPPTSRDRGRLVPAPVTTHAEIDQRVSEAERALDMLALPAGHVAHWAHAYDYAFTADGVVDVASDHAWHSIALTSRTGNARIRHVAVPREQDDVFRVARITNPFDGPLLPGPIDVYDHGQYLVTSTVEQTPSGGAVDIGLGVDPAVKIARNVEFREEAAGMLRGALRLQHAITIEVDNLTARPLELEVRERVPVAREGDDDVEVTIGKVEPAWEAWTPDPDAPQAQRLRGAYRWSFPVPARAKKQLRASYEIKIANKHELAGGNRREP